MNESNLAVSQRLIDDAKTAIGPITWLAASATKEAIPSLITEALDVSPGELLAAMNAGRVLRESVGYLPKGALTGPFLEHVYAERKLGFVARAKGLPEGRECWIYADTPEELAVKAASSSVSRTATKTHG